MASCMQIALLAMLAATARCLTLDASNQTSIRQAAATISGGLYAYHDPNATTGQFTQPEPWFWWLSGAGWTALIDYTVYTNDTSYTSDIHSALSQNLGANYDFAPAEQSGWEANDDQVYWVYSALTAMEYDFPPLPCKVAANNTIGKCTNSWYAVAAHAFDDFVLRWEIDSETCGGGLKWQYDPKAKGWNYKNAVTNGGFFQTAARLARYSGNQTYADWATKVWNWSVTTGLVGADYHVFDGMGDADEANCTSVDHDEWSYNIASYLHGAAHMYAFTNDSTWETVVRGLVTTANSTFFTPSANATGVMYEQMCEKRALCSTDQSSFKGSLANWLGKTAALVPSVVQDVTALLVSSARGAAASCSGTNGTCGTRWYVGGYDGQTGFGQELSALDAVLSLLAASAPELATLA
ncbi:hypothetical protein LTR53_008395 [Teratosphaeriaceae sp. CCFEE 6253]|nr:hypothetical protein LTR53_008395 [Teratosphaeriaceae sp. CCFEE 6253]